MIKILIIFLESLSVLIWLHISFRKNIEKSKENVLFCALYVLYYYIASNYGMKMTIDIIPVLLILLWIKTQFREKLGTSIIKIFFGMVGMGMTQLVVIWMLAILGSIMDIAYEKTYICGNIVSLLISIMLYLVFLKVRLKSLKTNLYFVLILIYVICLLTYLKYCFRENVGIYGGLYLAFTSILIFFVVVAIKGLKSHYELEQKRIELDMKEKYEEVYSMLLLELRLKQHDYKNQIAALYSMQMLYENKDELFDVQREYGDKLLKETRYDNLILECSNPVLSGYVYTKCNEAEREGISVEPSIVCSSNNFNICVHEIIEILGILINNAIEYLLDKDWEYRVVKIDIFEKLDKLHIEVANVAEYVSYDKLEEMFSLGYSTKGVERGIGLYSLKSIVQKHKGELIVENSIDMDINWFKVKLVI